MNYETLVLEIQNSYEEGVTPEHAERLAGKFLHAQLTLSEELRIADLDARMKKTGVRSIKAAVYMEAATKDPKKPSDTLLEHLVNMNSIVTSEQNSLDQAEALRDKLQNYLDIFRESHIHFRSIAKGTFGG